MAGLSPAAQSGFGESVLIDRVPIDALIFVLVSLQYPFRSFFSGLSIQLLLPIRLGIPHIAVFSW